MKKNIVIVLLIGLFLLMAGCGGAAGPKSAVEGFAAAAKAGDIPKMKSFCTGAMLELWGFIDEVKKLGMPGADEMDISKEFQGDVEVTIEEKEVTADTGKVLIKFVENEATFICVNLEGKWLISDMETPEGLLSEMMPQMKEAMEMMKNLPKDMPPMPKIPADMPEMPEPEGNE